MSRSGAERIAVAVLTASDTRTQEEDASGRLLAEGLERAGFSVVVRRLVRDDGVESALRELLAGEARAVIVTGGTGLSPRDRVPEAVRRICTRALPGFGELFRALSYREIGAAALASRAEAGEVGGKLVFALPGSPAACRLGLEELIAPQLRHLLTMAAGGGHDPSGSSVEEPPSAPRARRTS